MGVLLSLLLQGRGLYCYYSRRLTVPLLSSNKIRILLFKLSQPHLFPMLNFYTPENTRKTGMFSDVFKVYRNVTLGKNGLWQANYVKNNFLIQPVAPDDIIGVLRCHWKETRKGCCTSPKCSCRSNSLNHAYQRVDTVVGMAVITVAYVIIVRKVMMTMSRTVFWR